MVLKKPAFVTLTKAALGFVNEGAAVTVTVARSSFSWLNKVGLSLILSSPVTFWTRISVQTC